MIFSFQFVNIGDKGSRGSKSLFRTTQEARNIAIVNADDPLQVSFYRSHARDTARMGDRMPDDGQAEDEEA